MSLRVHDLAKQLGVSSKALLEKLHAMKVEVKSHMSVVPAEVIEKLKGGVAEKKETKIPPPPKVEKREKPTPPAKPRAVAPAKPTPAPTPPMAEPAPLKAPVKVQLRYPISVKDLSVKINVRVSDLIKALMQRKILATINQALDEKTVASLAEEFRFLPEKLPTSEEALILEHEKEDPKKLKPRAPIVTLMGHVDHGKTSLLDAIRKSDVVAGEAGGITQHIGAYEVTLDKGQVTFLDTPGHEAFTAMRARGANVTDVVVLVVAADDGIMPQTEEAIDHARAAEVPIVVAINKCDLPSANIDRVKQQLTEKNLVAEEWGGKTIMVPVSAKTKQGIPELLEMLLLEAELLELKANPGKRASGTVLESELSKGRGPVARVLVQDGALKVGEVVVCNIYYGKIRAMINDKGQRIHEALPSQPVEILGLSGVPQAGDRFYVVQDEKAAKQIVAERQEMKGTGGPAVRHLTLEELHDRIREGKIKEVKLILKGDVQGSLEALKGEIAKIEPKEVKLSIIHSGVGDINESDVMLAAASDAVVLGFHADILPRAEAVAKEEGVEIKLYNIIYEAVSEIKLAIEGLLEPVTKESFLGRAEVKQIFKISKVGNIAGCLAIKGKLVRAGNPIVRVIRDKERVFEGKLSALKRFKDDVKEVPEGQECGISVEKFSDFQVGDLIELYQVEKVAQKLDASR